MADISRRTFLKCAGATGAYAVLAKHVQAQERAPVYDLYNEIGSLTTTGESLLKKDDGAYKAYKEIISAYDDYNQTSNELMRHDTRANKVRFDSASKHFKGIIRDSIQKLNDPEQKLAVTGRLIYDGARMGMPTGFALIVDVIINARDSDEWQKLIGKNLKFKIDAEGKEPVSLDKLLQGFQSPFGSKDSANLYDVPAWNQKDREFVQRFIQDEMHVTHSHG